uniref:Uncharacterized protein n=1 Tax=Chrysotila carterae TaxID=13221 RepID=A0A7S4BJG5_CHRCT|mmetsp:Transcript_57849/g.125580  ORF Transcript_57849/g.125580 Transcript_57849/m.125580 type:complete len:444 (+) Transcript_57849:438-1769(+)
MAITRQTSKTSRRLSSYGEAASDALDPPATAYERARDNLLAFLRRPFWSAIAIVHILLIVADGAFFFFLLVGWHAMCTFPAKTDCEPRNWWYNLSVQLLNVLFTWGAIITLPERVANAVHLTQTMRSNSPGRDFYGRLTVEVWFSISEKHRRRIVAILLVNNLAQFANQASRIVYYSYELQDTFPGNLWTNLFFFLAMLAAGVAAGYKFKQERILRKKFPGRFPDPLADGIEFTRRSVARQLSRQTRSRASIALRNDIVVHVGERSGNYARTSAMGNEAATAADGTAGAAAGVTAAAAADGAIVKEAAMAAASKERPCAASAAMHSAKMAEILSAAAATALPPSPHIALSQNDRSYAPSNELLNAIDSPARRKVQLVVPAANGHANGHTLNGVNLQTQMPSREGSEVATGASPGATSVQNHRAQTLEQASDLAETSPLDALAI